MHFLRLAMYRVMMDSGSRSRSLMDLSSNQHDRQGLQSPPEPFVHRSLRDVQSLQHHPDENLLDVSPPGYPVPGTVYDPPLLDNDSDLESADADETCNIDVDMAIDNVTSSDINISDPLYLQCKTSRRMSQVDRLISVTNDGTFGTTVTSTSHHVGHLTDHANLHCTFHGSRIKKGTETVNQSISISFDPNTLVCISCATEHKILGNTPVTIAFSDQNFVASIVGKEGSCLGIVRMEDASLSDLTDLSLEILGNVRVPEGSVLLFGSASFLSRVGTGAYTTDWVSLVAQIEKKWRGIRVCPLIPMILTECPGTLAREIAEIAAWFATIYENNPLGLYCMWASAVAATEALSAGAIALPHMDSYKISVPLSLTVPCQFSSMTFLLCQFTSGYPVRVT
jgi:hypothetical protein